MTVSPEIHDRKPAGRASHPSAHTLPPWPTQSTTGPVGVVVDDRPLAPPPPTDESQARRDAPVTFPAGTERGAVPRPDTALIDLVDVFAVYPFRRDMPVCPHCVSEADQRALGLVPARIPGPVLDRYVGKALMTWGEEEDFKRLLPEIFSRLDRGMLGAPEALLGARLRRADWTRWPAAEAPAVRSALRAGWLTTLTLPPVPAGSRS